MKMWSGRFEQETDMLADLFNASLPFDIRLYHQDIRGSIAHCTMLGECGIIKTEEANVIIDELHRIEADIESGKLPPNDAEDVHMFVEGELIARIGDTGKKLHTARSRNDQVVTDFRLYVLESIRGMISKLESLIQTLLCICDQHLDTIMPGYTHMQKAQPITLCHHMAAYCEMFLRDRDRFQDCKKRVDILPLGSCALAGTTYPINRRRVADLLGFSAVSNNSMDGVSDRDFVAEYLFCCSLVSMHLSRLSEELILWSTDEFKFIRISDRFSTGSSIMPQKKNPDMAELMRGKTGRVYGHLMSILTTLKGLPLAYNKDMQEDKECLFDAENTVSLCLQMMNAMLPDITFNRDIMREGALCGFTNATDVADYLVKRGVPFRSAHEITGKVVLHCEKNHIRLENLSIQDYREFSPVFDEDIHHAVALETVVGDRKCEGAPSPISERVSLQSIRDRL